MHVGWYEHFFPCLYLWFFSSFRVLHYYFFVFIIFSPFLEVDVSSVKFTAYNAGHVLGAAMFLIEIVGVKVSMYSVAGLDKKQSTFIVML